MIRIPLREEGAELVKRLRATEGFVIWKRLIAEEREVSGAVRKEVWQRARRATPARE